jgi:ATP-dependent Lon protease
MILNERDSRHEQVLQVAQQMMTAARTAPKGKGVDIIEVAMVTESNIRILSDTMKQMYEDNGFKFFLRDADNILQAEGNDIPMMAEIETLPVDNATDDLTGELPVMPLRNLMIFPSIVMPVSVGRQPTLKLVNQAFQSKEPIIITTQKVSEVDSPKQKDLFPIAVIGKVLRVFEMPGGTITAILQATGPKVQLEEITSTRPFLKGKVSVIEEDMKDEKSDEFKTLIDTCKELSAKVIELSDEISPDTSFALKNLDNNEVLVNFISGNFPFPINEKYELLQTNNLKDRLYRLIQLLNKYIQLATLKQSIQMRTREELDRQQREYFLQQQIKNIQDELGNGQDDEIDELRKKGEKKRWKPEAFQFLPSSECHYLLPGECYLHRAGKT